MSLSICTSCLARTRISNAVIPTVTAASRLPSTNSSFHTSIARPNVVVKKKGPQAGMNAPKARQSRSARIKKKAREKVRPPAVGQRKAERSRIVLSNTNALPIGDLEKLSTLVSCIEPEGTLKEGDEADKFAQSWVGKMMTFDGPVLDQLREAKAFKTTQNWNLFRAPSTLVRAETADVVATMRYVKQSISGEEEGGPATVQRLVVGGKHSGKSIHLLQAMALAYENKWVVVNIPDCQAFVNNHSSYAPVPKSNENAEQMYNQPQLASEMLTRLAHSNSDVLSKLKLVHKHDKLLKDKKVKSVKDLALLGSEDSRRAAEFWSAVWQELTVPAGDAKGPARPPVLIAIDGVNFWMGETKYMSADYKPIHAQQFTIIKQFTDLLFPQAENPLPNGGMIMACTTKSNHPTTPAFDWLVKQRAAYEELDAEDEANFKPTPNPYMKNADKRVTDLLPRSYSIEFEELGSVQLGEAKGLLEYFARSGIFREAVTEPKVAELKGLSNGIIGDMCKLAARTRTSMYEIGARESSKLRG